MLMAVSRSCQVGPETTRVEPRDPGSCIIMVSGCEEAASGMPATIPRNSPARPMATLIVPTGEGPGSDSTTWITGWA